MPQMKLFGNSRSAARVAGKRKPDSEQAPKEKKQKKKKPLKVLAVWLTVILCLEGLYFFCCYTNNAFVAKWRTIYIQTAMSTMRHQWLATYLLPESVVDDVMRKRTESKEAFYELFWELDQPTMEAYVEENPSVLDNGWENININEAGLDDNGTSIQTTMGEQVLAINAKEQIMLVRVTGSGYRGVLAIAKDPSRLNVENSAGVGTYGQLTGDIASAHNGILATTCSGFIDIDAQGNWGNGNGGLIAGYAMSNGHGYGTHYNSYAGFQYYRLEIHEDNLIYIKKVDKEVSEDCRDATEFQPPIIIDGELLVSDYWVETNPRVCIGQSDKYGEYVIRGSNPNTRYTGSRPVPNAFVYHRVE